LIGVAFCFSALGEDDEHGVGVVDEVEDGEAHVVTEEVVTFVD